MPSIPWSPILSSIEDPMGVWTLRAGEDGEVTQAAYGVVRIAMRGEHPGYQAELLDGVAIGFYRTLLRAARAVWEGSMERSAEMRKEAVVNQGRGRR